MARKKENNATVAPLLGAGALGTTAYGSHRLDKFMRELGLPSEYKLNPEALRAFDEYTQLVPNAKDPSSFAYQYAQAANRAGGTQLFLNDPLKRTAWEWEINTPELRANLKNKLSWLLDKMDHARSFALRGDTRIGKHVARQIEKLQGHARGAKDTFLPLSEWVSVNMENAKKIAKDPAKVTPTVMKNLLAHVPAMAQSPLDSYIRLLSEIGPEVKAKNFADNTIEALLHYKNPTYVEHAGKSFSSPGEYLAEMWTPKGHKKINGVFDKYLAGVRSLPEGRAFFASENPARGVIDAFRNDIGLQLTPNSKKELPSLLGKRNGPLVRKLFTPGSSVEGMGMLDEVLNSVGRRSNWDILEENGVNKLKMTAPTRPLTSKGIRSIQDIRDLAHTHLGLQALDAITTARYSEAAKPYGLLTGILRKAQMLRNGKLRAGLALGSLGLGGLGAVNILRNRYAKRENGRWTNRIRNWLEDRIDRI